jgi:hypothetical protein
MNQQLPMQAASMPVGYAPNPTAPIQAYGAPMQTPMSPQQPVIPNHKRKTSGGLFGWRTVKRSERCLLCVYGTGFIGVTAETHGFLVLFV